MGNANGNGKALTLDAQRNSNGTFAVGNRLSRGRPKGARVRFGEAVSKILHADFEQHHEEILARIRAERPWEWLRLCIWHLRGHDRGEPIDEWEELHTSEEVIEALRVELGDEAARALTKLIARRALAKK